MQAAILNGITAKGFTSLFPCFATSLWTVLSAWINVITNARITRISVEQQNNIIHDFQVLMKKSASNSDYVPEVWV